MKVFVSHPRADSNLALRISERLGVRPGIASHLDVMEPHPGMSAQAPTDHVERRLGLCRQLLAGAPGSARPSWRVAWEIGAATEKDFLRVTDACGYATVPAVPANWPCLRSEIALGAYALASMGPDENNSVERGHLAEGVACARSISGSHRVPKVGPGR